MYTKELIEHTFLPHLQNNVNFKLRDKIIKKGKLLLVAHKGPYVSFVMNLANNNSVKHFDIPYPFNITHDEKCVRFDYRIETLCNNNSTSTAIASDITPVKKNKFYDCELEIIFN